MLPFEVNSEGKGAGKLVMNGGSSSSRINIYLVLNVHVGWRVFREGWETLSQMKGNTVECPENGAKVNFHHH